MFQEIIVDNFAGGGGASTGISLALGREVDIAINHDPAAIAMHKANHPDTEHYCENVWDVDPKHVVGGRPVALCWFSPDCKHFSKAKGGKPVEKKIRGLAWIVLKWAAKVRPRVIILENVEEFQTWGPVRKGKPVKKLAGTTFTKWKDQLQALGYKIEHREMKACDYGAPTIRKRFFLVARRDGRQIVWPNPTHGDPDSLEVKTGKLKPWRTAAEIIDWSLPCPSIFDRKKPLAENTMRRIARGIQKFVLDNPEPFIIRVNFSGSNYHYCDSIHKPLHTITAKNGWGLVAPTLIQYHGEQSKSDVRGQALQKPLMVVDASPRYALVASFLAKHYGGNYTGPGANLKGPVPTVTAVDHNALVTSHLVKMKGQNIGQSVTDPLQTITAGGLHFGEVRAFLMKYYGTGEGQTLNEPLHTVVGKDRFGLVTIQGQDYQIVDIGMRMLEPRELFAAQGFPEDYIIDRDCDGKYYPKSAQVARCGNAVPPPFAEALVRANLPEICTGSVGAKNVG
ncbi:MAG: cytosine-specific methylase [Firmicutes bacterium]|nr:cytosine-specific methylase [Bacillota bacterium]